METRRQRSVRRMKGRWVVVLWVLVVAAVIAAVIALIWQETFLIWWPRVAGVLVVAIVSLTVVVIQTFRHPDRLNSDSDTEIFSSSARKLPKQ